MSKRNLKKKTPNAPVQILSARIVEIEHHVMKLEAEADAIRHLLGVLVAKPKTRKRGKGL